jgi:hypothetical protein
MLPVENLDRSYYEPWGGIFSVHHAPAEPPAEEFEPLTAQQMLELRPLDPRPI